MIRRAPNRAPSRTLPAAALFAAFCAGMIVMWGLERYGPPVPNSELRTENSEPSEPRTPEPGKPAKLEAVPTTGVSTGGGLRMPLDGVNVEAMKGGFFERRGGGSRGHEAVDLLAPRNTPVHAVEAGTVAKLFNSKAGGLTIYQFDPNGRLVYYYAHLDHYADGLHEGQSVSQGDVIGYVGTTGNAPKDTPHLHFAVFETHGDTRWWKGEALDPYPIFRDRMKR